jgi:hypothetical protein
MNEDRPTHCSASRFPFACRHAPFAGASPAPPPPSRWTRGSPAARAPPRRTGPWRRRPCASPAPVCVAWIGGDDWMGLVRGILGRANACVHLGALSHHRSGRSKSIDRLIDTLRQLCTNNSLMGGNAPRSRTAARPPRPRGCSCFPLSWLLLLRLLLTRRPLFLPPFLPSPRELARRRASPPAPTRRRRRDATAATASPCRSVASLCRLE